MLAKPTIRRSQRGTWCARLRGEVVLEPRPRSPLLATALVALGLALYQFRAILGRPAGRLLGTATDALHHAWSWWWYGHSTGEGALTWLVSWPTGERGTLLSPLVALASQPWGLTLGPAFAYNLACFGVTGASSIALGLLAWRLSRDPVAGVGACALWWVGRPVAAHLGLGVVEGVTLAPAILGVLAAITWVTWEGGWRRGLGLAALTGLLFAVSVVENPYTLVPLVPGAIWAALARIRRARLPGVGEALGAALAGVATLGGRLWWVGGDVGGNVTTSVRFAWLGRTWEALEGERSLRIKQLYSPFPVVDFSAAAATIRDKGGFAFLGYSVLVLAVLGAVWKGRAPRWALALALIFSALALGSLPWGQSGAPGPFFFVNLVLSEVLTPLTQPFRFLALASAALALAGGLGYAELARRRPDVWPRVLAAVVAEALVLGGPALTIPTTDLASIDCLARLRSMGAGAVHLVPAGAVNPESVNTEALRMQLVHGLPGTHHGLGGWRAESRNRAFDGALQTLVPSLTAAQPHRGFQDDTTTLLSAGLTWVILPRTAVPAWAGASRADCGGWSAFRLDELADKAATATPSRWQGR